MRDSQTPKEQRIKKIIQLYYSRRDIQGAIFDFSKDREVVPSYMMESFGKRPDSLQYPGDIFELVKGGATSFHCSEELWEDPLKISTDMNEKQLDELRKGWDLLIDIDCKWFDFSKKAAQAIIKALKFREIKNFKIKFSGNKGFHIIIPWRAFPKEINEIKTSDMFPAWPRIVVGYIKEISRPILEDMMGDDINEFRNVEGLVGIKCEECKNLAVKSYQITINCDKHKFPHTETFISTSKDYDPKKCPNCKSIMDEKSINEFYTCNECNLNSLKNPENFKEGVQSTDIFKILGLDVLLVSPRHLFRMPYSLHEKTALASVVLKPEELKDFQPKDADPLKAKTRNFMPEPEEGEATELLREALDWYKNKYPGEEMEKSEKKKFDFRPVRLTDLSEKHFPPAIKKILQGVEDGRKRALFILINFFRSIGMDKEELEKRIYSCNEKNEVALKTGYIKSQLSWSYRHEPILPPNYDKDYYKGIGIVPTEEEIRYKNPVNYVIRKSRQENRTERTKTQEKKKGIGQMGKDIKN